MTGSIIVINVDIRETRVALVEGGVIAELQIERASQRGTVGNIVLGKVTRVLPGMQAAFIDVGQERSAFLHVEDLIRPDDFDLYLAQAAGDFKETVRRTSDNSGADEDDDDDKDDSSPVHSRPAVLAEAEADDDADGADADSPEEAADSSDDLPLPHGANGVSAAAGDEGDDEDDDDEDDAVAEAGAWPGTTLRADAPLPIDSHLATQALETATGA